MLSIFCFVWIIKITRWISRGYLGTSKRTSPARNPTKGLVLWVQQDTLQWGEQKQQNTEPLFGKSAGLRNHSRHMEDAGGAVGGARVWTGVSLYRGDLDGGEEREREQQRKREEDGA